MERPPTVEPQPAEYYRRKAAARFYIQAATDEFFGVPGEANGMRHARADNLLAR
jgi:hypothetical protein